MVVGAGGFRVYLRVRGRPVNVSRHLGGLGALGSLGTSLLALHRFPPHARWLAFVFLYVSGMVMGAWLSRDITLESEEK